MPNPSMLMERGVIVLPCVRKAVAMFAGTTTNILPMQRARLGEVSAVALRLRLLLLRL